MHLHFIPINRTRIALTVMAPSALTSQRSLSITVPAKPPQPTPETAQEAIVPEVSLSEENIALEQRIVQFELAEKRHVE